MRSAQNKHPVLARVVMSTVLGLVTMTAVASCSPSSSTTRYAYSPVATTNTMSAEIDGRSAAVVTIGSGLGELQLASLGVERVIPPSELHLPEFRALYVRMTVVNASRETWTVDEALQRIEIEERGSPIVYHAVTVTGERPPILEIEPGKSYWLDLMFPLGETAGSGGARRAGTDDVRSFDVLWRIQASEVIFTGRVAFQRHLESPDKPISTPTYHPTSPLPYRIPGRYPSPPPVH